MVKNGGRLPIFVDIDGTLTDFGQQGGNPLPERIGKINRLIRKGIEVIVWSGGGTEYAKEFAEKNGIIGAVCIGKPEIMVDDNPNVRPVGTMTIVEPMTFFERG
jgi:ribonucleotide monophosphatase NagD (HAD superfamily)